MKQNTNEVDTSVVLTEIKTKDAEKKKLRTTFDRQGQFD